MPAGMGQDQGVSTEHGRTTEKIVLKGAIDIAAVAQLNEQIQASSATAVVIDASGVTFIDSVGLGALLDAKDRLQADERELYVVHRTPMLNKLLDMAGMGEAFA
jgi:anti-anti-sigma factor